MFPSAFQFLSKNSSHLAFCLLGIRDKRKCNAMQLLYTFCSAIDEIADSEQKEQFWREAELQRWEDFFQGKENMKCPLADKIKNLQREFEIPNEHFLDFILGCKMDINPRQRYETWEELSIYTYRVASAVGLMTIKILYPEEKNLESYAISLGHGMQITNIIRDISEDFFLRGRIYLPQEDLRECNYSEKDIAQKNENINFQKLMCIQAKRAREFYKKAEHSLPPHLKSKLKIPEKMRAFYESILEMIERENFPIYRKKFRLSLFRRLSLLLK